MTITFRADELESAQNFKAALLAQPTAEPLSGDIKVGTHLAFTSPDERILSGSWETEPGESRWEFTERGEFIHVIAGRMTVQEDGGEPIELTPGATAIFPIGWKGIWTVHEKMRKVFVIYKP